MTKCRKLDQLGDGLVGVESESGSRLDVQASQHDIHA